MITREPIYTHATEGLFESFHRYIVQGVREIGRAGIITMQSIALIPTLFRSRRAIHELLHQLYVAGIKTLPVITVVGLFTGMILGLQIGLSLRRFNQESLIGAAVMISLLREMGPFVTGICLSACVGSSIAAQIGTMTVNDEIAALEIMSINPIKYLMTPRMGAMIIMTPILAFYACVFGVLGGGIVGNTQLNVPWEQYIASAMTIAEVKDLLVGLLKASVFGVIIVAVSCYEGFSSTQGAVGVGQATQRCVIISFLLILMFGYMITRMFYIL